MPSSVLERDVTAAVVRFMTERGWVAKRRNVGLLYTKDGRPVRIGKPGEPDWMFVHRQHGYLEVEMKRPGQTPDKHQAEYLATVRALGIEATWTDSAEKFERWYAATYETVS